MSHTSNLTIIGRNAKVDFIGHTLNIPAKIDTGADSSSIWVTNVAVDKSGTLSFVLLSPEHPLYTGETITRSEYSVAIVRSASGHEQIRYRTNFSVRIAKKRIRVTCNLSDRSRNKFPMLIGRRSLTGKFVVDVSLHSFDNDVRVFEKQNGELRRKLLQNPYEFHRKYYDKDVQ